MKINSEDRSHSNTRIFVKITKEYSLAPTHPNGGGSTVGSGSELRHVGDVTVCKGTTLTIVNHCEGTPGPPVYL